MKYYVTNPKDGAEINAGELTLKINETKEFKELDALWLERTYGFLTLKTEEGIWGDYPDREENLIGDIDEQEENKEEELKKPVIVEDTKIITVKPKKGHRKNR